jgi:hypothetical protein
MDQDRDNEAEPKLLVVDDDEYVLLGSASELTRNGKSNITESNNGKGRG